jgi:hypothetical protein
MNGGRVAGKLKEFLIYTAFFSSQEQGTLNKLTVHVPTKYASS